MKKNTSNKVDHLLKHVVAAVKKAESKEDALQKCINEVCTQLEWPIGHVYFSWCSGLYGLDSSKIWFLDNPVQYKVFREITETTKSISLDIDVDLPGRVLTTKRPAWIPDVTKDTNFPRANRAQDIGVKAAFAFPVILHSEVIAVLEFFSPLAIEPDEQILESVENIGKQVGKVIKTIEYNQNTAQFRELEQGIEGRDSRKIKPENFICPKYLDTYTREIETIWQQVIGLNAYIYCIEHIKEFPFDLFKHNPSPFWTCVEKSMFESLSMVINRIFIDKSCNTLTLKKFKDEIVDCFIREECKEQFLKELEGCQFGKIGADDTDIVSKFKTLRDKRFAHLDIKFNTDISDKNIEKRTVYLTEICEFRENIITLSLMLNLGHVFRRTDPETDFYDLNYPLADAKDPSDIEVLLDTIAKKSAIMNMPKEDPEGWRLYRKLFDDSQIEIFNRYREKFDLSPVV